MLNTYQRNRLLLLAAATCSAALFWLGGWWFGIPHYPGFEASLALQPHPVAALLLAGVMLALSVTICTGIAGTVRFDAGLFTACIGMTALSIRGGPVRFVYQSAFGRSAALAMAVELVVLYAFLGLAWFGLVLLYRRGKLLGDALRDGLEDQPHLPGERVSAAGMQAAAMAVGMLLLARTDDQKQALAAVFVSSFLATLVAYAFNPVRPSVSYWAGPLAVGVVGYVAAYLNWGRGSPSLWKAGLAAGFLAPFARPLPLDYATLGPAGAIVGYWMSRRWQRTKELEEQAQGTATAS